MTRADLDRIFTELARDGHELVGPTLQGAMLAYDRVESSADLPEGFADEQAKGRYRVRQRGDRELFGYAAPLGALRRFLQAPEERLFRISKKGAPPAPPPAPAPLAVIGVRACDLAAVSIQDRVLMGGEHRDERYAARRQGAWVVAVACTRPASTCFCASMDAGPEPRAGYDLTLTELYDDTSHRFTVRAGSERGRALIERLDLPEAGDDCLDDERKRLDAARSTMAHGVDAGRARLALAQRPEHPRWDDVAARCLSCANCTLLCPTCFCSTTEDTAALDGEGAERRVRWDSCFNADHSYVHGGSVRSNTRSRYRQWLLHKFSTWHDQFDTAGCVGCGRCISGCPAGIDVREEIEAIARDPS